MLSTVELFDRHPNSPVPNFTEADPIIDNHDGGAKYVGRLWDAERQRFVLVRDEPFGLQNAISEIIGPMPAPPSGDVGSDVLTSTTHDAQGHPITTYSFDPLPGARLSAQAQEYNTVATVWTARMMAMLGLFTPTPGKQVTP